ncbi:aspartate kinase [Roseisolibacter agri]|nr:aspartate kinase [Roseisolibacter agri]
MPSARPAPLVHKFGGAALADADAVRHAASIVAMLRTDDALPTAVVVSAMHGVTDALLDASHRATHGDATGARHALDALRRRHDEAARRVAGDGGGDESLSAVIDATFGELAGLLDGLAALGDLPPSVADAVLARGERLSARLAVAALAAIGVPAQYVDECDVIQTDGRPGNAFPDLPRTAAAARRVLAPLLARGTVAVIPGFVGAVPARTAAHAAPSDAPRRVAPVVTLGRGGSDLTATTLARVLGARDVFLWKDVRGLLTADPRVVPDARVIPALHAREASELAYHGAKVLHPRALVPLLARSAQRDAHREAGVPAPRARVTVRPFADPTAPGTTIVLAEERRAPGATSSPPRHPVKAVSALGGQALVTVRGTGMAGVPGIAARAFGALERAGISVALISQASSEQSICIGVPQSATAAVEPALREAFAAEIARGEIEGIDVEPDVATVAVVGSGMAGVPGIAARFFGALADAQVNVVAIAQGSSELNISAVVAGKDAAAAQRAAHAAFRLDRVGGGAARAPQHADVVLLGFGKVGRELARQITQRQSASRADGTQSPVSLVGVVDSRGWVFDAAGLAPRRLASLSKAKAEGRALAELPGGAEGAPDAALAHIAAHALSRPILVDVTAGDTSALLDAAVHHGMDLVLANKKPLAEGRVTVDAATASAAGLVATAAARGRRVLHEATVGAGLPVIDTVRKLQESGDRILHIQGCPSGTLGFLFAELGRGRAFSDALRDAMARGYTEPDPREDLSGQDVARKAVILARLVGWKGTLDDVAVESLVPPALAALPLQEFLAQLESLDAPWAARVAAAAARGAVLRYRADVSPKEARVGIVEVDRASPFASLSGTDNQFVFTTRRYKERPLVITGPGAGPEVTAAGVLNDVLALAGAR